MNPTCEDRGPQLAALAVGELEGEEKAEVLKHVESCLTCQAELAELCSTASFLEARFGADALTPKLAERRVAEITAGNVVEVGAGEGNARGANGAKDTSGKNGMSRNGRRHSFLYWSSGLAAAAAVTFVMVKPLVMQPGPLALKTETGQELMKRANTSNEKSDDKAGLKDGAPEAAFKPAAGTIVSESEIVPAATPSIPNDKEVSKVLERDESAAKKPETSVSEKKEEKRAEVPAVPPSALPPTSPTGTTSQAQATATGAQPAAARSQGSVPLSTVVATPKPSTSTGAESATAVYDPTNGTTSQGDVYRSKDGAVPVPLADSMLPPASPRGDQSGSQKSVPLAVLPGSSQSAPANKSGDTLSSEVQLQDLYRSGQDARAVLQATEISPELGAVLDRNLSPEQLSAIQRTREQKESLTEATTSPVELNKSLDRNFLGDERGRAPAPAKAPAPADGRGVGDASARGRGGRSGGGGRGGAAPNPGAAGQRGGAPANASRGAAGGSRGRVAAGGAGVESAAIKRPATQPANPPSQAAVPRESLLRPEISDSLGRDIAGAEASRRLPDDLKTPAIQQQTSFGLQAAPSAMFFDSNTKVNPFVETAQDPLSTFSIDVDKASYVLARNYLNRVQLPPPQAIRVEEFINYFPSPDPAPANDTFAVYGEMTPSPFHRGQHLLKIGIKGREAQLLERKALVLTFVIDVSGSMQRENRIELVKRTLHYLVGKLNPTDRIGIAVFGTNGRILMPHRPVSERVMIDQAIDSIRTEGSTNTEEGLRIGYEMARQAFTYGTANRVILCSDGVANVGRTGPQEILNVIQQRSKDDIYLTTLGFGMGNYNDVLMEQLADKGNGHYGYLDSDQEAQRFIEKDLTQSMQVIAQDVKIQVAFDPKGVKRYRLLGYENRDIADQDFRNDKVDAGEIGSGHSVTALYELELAENAGDDVALVQIRYKQPDQAMAVKEIQGPLRNKAIAKPSFAVASEHFRTVVLAAQFAEILRHSPYAQDVTMADVVRMYDQLFGGNTKTRSIATPELMELRSLMSSAASLVPPPQVGRVPMPRPFDDGPIPPSPKTFED